MKFKHLAILAAAVICLPAAQGSININLQAEILKDQNGVAGGTSMLVILAASTLDLTFDPVQPGTLSEGGMLDGIGGDDQILYMWDLRTNDTPGLFVGEQSSFTFSGNWNQGDPLALFWFPALSMTQTTATPLMSYGSFVSGVGLDGSDPWVTPANGAANHQLYFITNGAPNIGPGSHDPAAGNASLTVVPEPSTSFLLAVSGMALFGFGRRRSH